MNAAIGRRHTSTDSITLLVGLAAAALFAYVAAVTPDEVMAFHMVLLALGAVVAAGVVLKALLGGSVSDPNSDTSYFDGPIKVATLMAVFWGIAGFLVGDIIAWQLAFPALNFDLPWTSFGRLRPLHTSAVIFAFGGNVLLATSFYVVQRTCQARMFGRWSPWFVVIGFQLFMPSPAPATSSASRRRKSMRNLNGTPTSS
jgi:cytochrome c oxidase cbb3-type subunit 1